MKIGIDARFYGGRHAGLGRYTKNLVDQLANFDGENSYIIYLHRSNADEFQTDNPNFARRIIDVSHYSFQEQIALPRLLAQDGLDIAHFTHLNVPVRYRQPYVVTIHDLIMHTFKNRAATTHTNLVYEAKHMAYRMVTRQAALRARHIIVPSQAVKDELMAFYKLPEQRITVTYEAADDVTVQGRIPGHEDPRIHEVLERLGIKRPFIMYVGNVYPHKNIELLARSMQELHEKYGLTLVMPSARNVFLERTEAMMKKHGVMEHVMLPGFVPDDELRVLYSQADAYVFPTLAEGFGLPPLEAMAAGAPVICSDIPVLREVCGDAALYFDPQDTRSLITQVGNVVTDKELRDELIAKGRAREKQFSWKKMAEQTLSVYKQSLGWA
jgi:glycosyltransferase involved in cell wall biosynthesis